MAGSLIPIVNAILTSINVAINLGREDNRLQGEIEGILEQLVWEVKMVEWDLLKYEDDDPELTLMMHEVLSNIDDFTIGMCLSGRAATFFKSLMARDSRPFAIQKIESYLKTLRLIVERQTKLSAGNDAATNLASAAAAPLPYYALKGDPNIVEFLELLSPTHDGELKVISIVGSSGLGKTSLASAVYQDAEVQIFSSTTEIDDQLKFHFKYWISASMCTDTNELRKELESKIDLSWLHDKRYLVIIDDLWSRDVHWKDIEQIFPRNDKNCRIIVTTRVHSIAHKFSSGNYYMYPMKSLGEANSKELFSSMLFGDFPRDLSEAEVKRAEVILAKCAGSPLALISAGKYLCSKDRQPHLSSLRYKEVSKELDHILETDESAFSEMKRRCIQCYKDLSDSDQKICLLYFSMFPRGHQVSSKFVARKIEAEALVSSDALECLDKLVDNSMLVPVESIHCCCGVPKSCQIQGIMLGFVIRKSLSRNFVSIVDKEGLHKNESRLVETEVRRLIIQSCKQEFLRDINLPTVRSLTIFPCLQDICVDKIDFKSCKMMRVLDLEGCNGLSMSSGSVLDNICELLFLKYLNLKNTDVDEVPTKIRNLKYLETLDIRQTRVAILPLDVIMLPALVHLFGKFELPRISEKKKKALISFLREKSRLRTLAGIIIKKDKSFEVVIRYASDLKKIKIFGNKHIADPAASTRSRKIGFGGWFNLSQQQPANLSLPAPNRPSNKLVLQNADVVAKEVIGVLVSSLLERFSHLESIFIDSNVICKFFVASDLNIDSPIISSIKLRGPLTSLTTRTFKELKNLTKLHLFSTGLSSKQLVEALQTLKYLEYLKLGKEDHAGSWEGDFCVQCGGFPSLRELCFEGPKIYPRVMILEGAMRLLSSLQLLCHKSPVGGEAMENHQVRVEGIGYLKYLNEVILHYSADATIVSAWKNALRSHINEPCVKKQTEQAQSAINNTS